MITHNPSSAPHAQVPGAPQVMLQDLTPLPADLPTLEEDPSRVDIDATLRILFRQFQRRGAAIESTTDGLKIDLEAFEKKLSRSQKWGSLITGLLGILASIFVAGMAFAALKDQLATDEDVNRAIIEHNEVDPATRDPVTLEQIGSHPVLKKQIAEHQAAIDNHDVDITTLQANQVEADQRNEYQFEFARWQAQISECERTKRCKPPAKPSRLEQLETDLLLGRRTP